MSPDAGNGKVDDFEYNVITRGGQSFRWLQDRVLYVCLDAVTSNSQRLVCVAWPENDEKYPDRQALLDAAADMMTESFVADAISVAIDSGWTPSQPGRDFVVQFEDGTFVALGESPV